MTPIPILGTQTLNSLTNVKKLIKSIDYPVKIFSLIINNENFEVLLDIKNFCDSKPNEYIEKFELSWHPANLGCAPSWNYHFKQYPQADFYIKPDDDIEFSKGDLKRMVDSIKSGYDMVFYGDGPTKYACFGITKNTLKTVGLFEENSYPANYEDDDYNIRIKLCNIKELVLSNISFHEGCGTSKNLKDHSQEHPILSECLKQTEEYFFKKWGNRHPNNFAHPFNNEKIRINDVSYDFNFREKKYFRCNYTK